MNFTQMHERLRLELLRRIQRGTLSVSLLARQTGFGQPHLSNFLRSRRQLSLDAMDRILSAQHLTAHDLLPMDRRLGSVWFEEDQNTVPVVSHATALFEPMLRASAVLSLLHLPAGALPSIRARATVARKSWQRFVAIRVPPPDAHPMEPLVLPDAVAVIDRHYNSFTPYRPARPNLYAVRNGSHLTVRYVDLVGTRLILRPLNVAFPADLLEPEPGTPPAELLAGRVALILNET